jgi:hypothetical protein
LLANDSAPKTVTGHRQPDWSPAFSLPSAQGSAKGGKEAIGTDLVGPAPHLVIRYWFQRLANRYAVFA